MRLKHTLYRQPDGTPGVASRPIDVTAARSDAEQSPSPARPARTPKPPRLADHVDAFGMVSHPLRRLLMTWLREASEEQMRELLDHLNTPVPQWAEAKLAEMAHLDDIGAGRATCESELITFANCDAPDPAPDQNHFTTEDTESTEQDGGGA